LGVFDAFVRRYNHSGGAVWTRQFGTGNWDWAAGISATPEGVYVAGGTAGALPGERRAGANDAFVHRVVAYRPDALIGRSATSPFTGNGTYSDTGKTQTVSKRARPGTARTYYLRIQNDGDAAHRIAIKGCRRSSGFGVRYLRGISGTAEITKEVIAGTYEPHIASGAFKTVRSVIRVRATAPVGAKKICSVSATSKPQPAQTDTVRAKVTVAE